MQARKDQQERDAYTLTLFSEAQKKINRKDMGIAADHVMKRLMRGQRIKNANGFV